MQRKPARSKRVPADSAVDDEQKRLKLGFFIHDTARLRRTAFDQALQPLGITSAQANVLRLLSGVDGRTQIELAAALELGKVALGDLVRRLEAAGLVERHGKPEDRRAKRIFLTAAGRRTVTRLRKLGIAMSRDMFDGLSERDVATASAILRTIKANLLCKTRR